MGYRARLLLGLLLISIPSLTILTLDGISVSRNLLYDRELKRINSIGDFLSREIVRNLVAKDTIEVESILDLRVKQHDVQFISIIGPKNMVRYSTDSASIDKPNQTMNSPSLMGAKESLFIKSFPLVSAKGKVLGNLQIGFSLKGAYVDMKNALIRAFAIDIPIVLLTLLVGWYLSGRLQKPLIEIKQIADEIAGGNFSRRAPVESIDVIGQLGDRMNNMAEKLKDLTDNLQHKIKQATLELQISKIRLEEMNNLKSEFLGMVSHDMKTPLTSMVGFAKTLKSLALSKEDIEKYLTIIENEGNRLSQMVEDFLDISKMETGHFSVNAERFDFHELLEDTIALIQVPQDVQIRVQPMNDISEIDGDPAAIRRVLENIIDNAIKYGGIGEITVAARKSREGLQVSVHDNGPGIDPSELSKIFDRFYRVRHGGKKKKGSGLGLSIVKNIVEAHKGRVWCESGPGKGTTMYFVLPDYKNIG